MVCIPAWLLLLASVWGGVRWVVGSGPAFLSPGWLVGTGAGPWPGLEMERETQSGQARVGWVGSHRYCYEAHAAGGWAEGL